MKTLLNLKGLSSWMPVIAIFLLFLPSTIASQNKVVRGKVTTLNGLRLGNIDVKAKKANSWVKTDSVGEYFIVSHDNDVLVFEGKVFRSRRIRIRPDVVDSVNVELEFIPSARNREVAVGYGYMTESEMTAAVSHMDNTDVDFCRYSNIYELIKGRFPGVQVVGTGGEPEIIIRGQKSLMASNRALYVVDGLVVNTIFNISPCQVRSINVIKDGSAAIYGSRGANGVVVIETIRGPRLH